MSGAPPSWEAPGDGHLGIPATVQLALAFLSTSLPLEIRGSLKSMNLSDSAFVLPCSMGPTSPLAQPIWHSTLRSYLGRRLLHHEKELHVGWYCMHWCQVEGNRKEAEQGGGRGPRAGVLSCRRQQPSEYVLPGPCPRSPE